MIIFSYVALFLLSIILFYIAKFISKKTKIPSVMIYLFLGIIFGVGGLAHFNSSFYIFGLGNNFLNEGVSKYNSIVVLLLFFEAGYSIDLKPFTKEGRKNIPDDGSTKDVLKLSIIPAYFEIFVMCILGYFIYNFFPGTNIKLSIVEVGIVAGVFALNSSSVIIPACMKYISAGKMGSKNLAKTLIISSISDNFTPMPLILIFVMMLIGGSIGISINPFVIIPVTIILIIAIIFISLFFGKLITYIFNFVGIKVVQNKLNISVYAILLFIMMLLFVTLLKQINPLVDGIVSLFGIVIAAFIGTGVNFFEKNNLGSKLGSQTAKFFTIFGMPIMFFSVGSSIEVTQFSKVVYVLMFIVITLLSIVTKSVAELYILRNGYNLGDKKFAVSTLIAKGVTLINFSVILVPILGPNEPLIKIMTALAAVSLTLTLPVAIVLMNSKGENWLQE